MSNDGPTLDELRAMATEPRQWTRTEARQQRKRDRQASACDGKTRHPDERAARHAAFLRRWAVEPYRCEFCDGWHVGARS